MRGKNVGMKNFTAVVERDPVTGLLVGYVPGFPGAHSQAESLDELNANLRSHAAGGRGAEAGGGVRRHAEHRGRLTMGSVPVLKPGFMLLRYFAGPNNNPPRWCPNASLTVIPPRHHPSASWCRYCSCLSLSPKRSRMR